ncbi:uncharacterized protein LOC136043475 [Artemia franciscana]|uniref:uncharacterized protein LOC136043475 n=1 Tax=Artemia franciscana TaxID=6661 RepID=UPI0032DAA6FB
MPSGSLKLTLDITIHKVECPGMHLSFGDKLLVRFCILNYHLRTSKINKGPAYAFNERFFLQKSFPLCFQPRNVIELLAGDKCVLELVAIRNVIPVTLARFPIDTISFIFEALQTIKTDEIVEKRMKLRLHKVRNEKHLDIKTENHSPLQGIIRSAAPRILYEKSRPQFRYRHVDEKLLLRVPCLLEPSTVNHEKEFQQRKPLKFSMGYSRNWINSVCGEAMWCDSRIYEKRTLNKLKMISFDGICEKCNLPKKR